MHPCVSARARAQRSPDPETQQRHDPHAPVHRRTMPFLVTRCGVLETPGIVPAELDRCSFTASVYGRLCFAGKQLYT